MMVVARLPTGSPSSGAAVEVCCGEELSLASELLSVASLLDSLVEEVSVASVDALVSLAVVSVGAVVCAFVVSFDPA